MVQVLTLANGDRILMTPQMKAFFEVSSSGLVVFTPIQKCEGNGHGSAGTHVLIMVMYLSVGSQLWMVLKSLGTLHQQCC